MPQKKSKRAAPVFSVEQLDYLISLFPESKLTSESPKEDFLLDYWKRLTRRKFKNLAEKQGYAI